MIVRPERLIVCMLLSLKSVERCGLQLPGQNGQAQAVMLSRICHGRMPAPYVPVRCAAYRGQSLRMDVLPCCDHVHSPFALAIAARAPAATSIILNLPC